MAPTPPHSKHDGDKRLLVKATAGSPCLEPFRFPAGAEDGAMLSSDNDGTHQEAPKLIGSLSLAGLRERALFLAPPHRFCLLLVRTKASRDGDLLRYLCGD